MTKGIREGCSHIDKWVAEGKQVVLHCSAGLSRSASVVVAWLMRAKVISLKNAIELVYEKRGRRLQINPTIWMALAQWERELFKLGPRTMPSYDFRDYWVEDFSHMGFENFM